MIQPLQFKDLVELSDKPTQLPYVFLFRPERKPVLRMTGNDDEVLKLHRTLPALGWFTSSVPPVEFTSVTATARRPSDLGIGARLRILESLDTDIDDGFRQATRPILRIDALLV